MWHIKLNLAIVHRLIDKNNPSLTIEKERGKDNISPSSGEVHEDRHEIIINFDYP